MDAGGPIGECLDLRSMLKLHEGYRAKPYKDTVGKLTIGFGRNLTDNGIRPTEAEFLLDNDIKEATMRLRITFPWTESLDLVRQAVLIDMTFNMGIGGLSGFKTTLRLIEVGDYANAAAQMLRSKWAEQVGMKVGQRAWRLSTMMRTGEWASA